MRGHRVLEPTCWHAFLSNQRHTDLCFHPNLKLLLYIPLQTGLAAYGNVDVAVGIGIVPSPSRRQVGTILMTHPISLLVMAKHLQYQC